MKKDISFKMWLSVFFGGIRQFFRNIFSWKDKTPFWRVIWITNTVCIIAVISMFVIAFHKESHRNYSYTMEYTSQYDYEDVAAVCEGDSIHYIDHKGNPINNIKFLRDKRYDNYAYHGKYAAIPVGKKYGLIDKSGEWIVSPTYDDIRIGAKNLWYVSNDGKTGVVGTEGKMMLPLEYEYVWIHGKDGITVASAADHSQSRYDYDGTLLDDFIFDEVYEMAYYINEFDDEGNQKKAVDDMMKYSANNFYGLITRNGIPVTPPLYSEIDCVKPGVYQCRVSKYFSDCVMVNAKGEKFND